ncbi:MAG: YajG family lipoprotein [Pontibacterium sp.]
MKIKAIAISLLTLVLSACAGLNAQNLDLHPSATATGYIPPTATFSLKVVDGRSSALVGERQDRLGNQAPISLTDASAQLHHAIEHALEDANVNFSPSPKFKLTVYLDELTYKDTIKNLLHNVETAVTLRFVIDRNGTLFTGTYGAKNEHKIPNTPTPEQNNEMFDKLIGETITRALGDNELLTFLYTDG